MLVRLWSRGSFSQTTRTPIIKTLIIYKGALHKDSATLFVQVRLFVVSNFFYFDIVGRILIVGVIFKFV